MFLSAGMLGMLNMLNVLWPIDPTHMSFSISAGRTHFRAKCASFCCSTEYVESCWMQCSKEALLAAVTLNMLNVFLPIDPPCQINPRTFNMINIFNISAERIIFHNLQSNMIQHFSTLQQKEAFSVFWAAFC